MLQGNAMAKALAEAGMIKPVKTHKYKHKPIKCRKCGELMTQDTPDDNFAYCKECGNYLIFSGK